MLLAMQILLVIGVGLIIYAIFGISTSASSKVKPIPLSPADPGKEQKIQRLQNSVADLENQLANSKEAYAKEESAFNKAKENESNLLEELKRRDEWVAKAEAELAKIKLENTDLNNKFITKEKELQVEFANSVNLTRQLNENKSALAEKEKESRLKDDQIQAQKHKIEEQIKVIKEHLGTIAEFNKKEKISEWVPKEEFNRLNEEYSKLENEFEENLEKLKSFAEEIAHLRQKAHDKIPLVSEEPKPEEVKPEEIKPKEATEGETKQEEINPAEENQEEKKGD